MYYYSTHHSYISCAYSCTEVVATAEHQDSVEEAVCDFNLLMFGCLFCIVLQIFAGTQNGVSVRLARKKIIAAAFFVVAD